MIIKKLQYRLVTFLKPIFRRLGTLEINWGYLTFTFVSVIAIVLLTGNIYRIIKKGYDRYAIIQQEQVRLDELKRKNEELTEELEYYSSKEYVDLVAREELNLAFPNQHLVYPVEEVSFLEFEKKQDKEEPLKPSWRLWYDLIF